MSLLWASALIGADEFALGLNCGPPLGANDNLNSLMLRLPGGGPGGAFYSLAAGGLGPVPFYGPADIISPFLPLGVPWAPAGALGLVPGDDIDALIIQDLSPAPLYAPGVDFVAFSLTGGSPTLGFIGAAPGDLLLAVPAGPPVIFIQRRRLAWHRETIWTPSTSSSLPPARTPIHQHRRTSGLNFPTC